MPRSHRFSARPTDHHRHRGLLVLPTALAVVVLLSAPIGAQSDDVAGFIHGEVTTDSGQTFRGLLRWGTEEAFWDDLFNSSKVKTPHLEDHGTSSRGRSFEIAGRRISVNWGGTGRVFVARFGDIRSIEARKGDAALLRMKDGSEIEVEGSANDVSATIAIRDPGMGDIEVSWKKIDTIVFSPAPASTTPWGRRLHGTVETDAGTFRGYVQWDKQECLSEDELDGEADDVNVSLKMGQIRSIERNGRQASDVVMRDGRRLTVSGTNDVDDDNRGILVEDDRFGRVEIPWMSFRKVTFDDAGSGPGYASYDPSGELRGVVRTSDGRSLEGRIVFDLDEERDWEMLDGDLDDISYSVPFGRIRSIQPRGDDGAEVVLRNGESLRLSDSQDVTGQNDGVLVLSGGDATLVRWEEIRTVEFE